MFSTFLHKRTGPKTTFPRCCATDFITGDDTRFGRRTKSTENFIYSRDNAKYFISVSSEDHASLHHVINPPVLRHQSLCITPSFSLYCVISPTVLRHQSFCITPSVCLHYVIRPPALHHQSNVLRHRNLLGDDEPNKNRWFSPAAAILRHADVLRNDNRVDAAVLKRLLHDVVVDQIIAGRRRQRVDVRRILVLRERWKGQHVARYVFAGFMTLSVVELEENNNVLPSSSAAAVSRRRLSGRLSILHSDWWKRPRRGYHWLALLSLLGSDWLAPSCRRWGEATDSVGSCNAAQ